MSQRHRIIRLSDGTIIMDVIGADSGNESEDDTDDLDDDDADTGGDDDDDSDESEPSVDDLKEQLAEAQRAKAKAERRMKSADRAKTAEVQKRQALEAKLNGKGSDKDSDKDDEDDKSTSAEKRRITELEQELESLKRPKPEQILYDGFRDLNDIDWHDPKLAFSQLDLSEIDVDENGKFEADDLKDALKDLAKSRPYLVKSTESTDDEEDADEKAPSNPSGQKFNGRRRSNSSKNRTALTDKYRLDGR